MVSESSGDSVLNLFEGLESSAVKGTGYTCGKPGFRS
jgi:hypothetical protein